MVEKLLSPKQVSSLLSVSEKTLYRLRKNKKIPYLRIGNQIRFLQNDLAKFFNNCKR